MICKLENLRNKNVVNIKNGVNLGLVDDVIIDTKTATVLSLVIYGRKRFFGLFGREEDMSIPWEDINIIGDDVVLIEMDIMSNSQFQSSRRGFLKSIFK